MIWDLNQYLTEISDYLGDIEDPNKEIGQAIKEINAINTAMKTGQPDPDNLRGPAERLAALVPAIQKVDQDGAAAVESISRNILAALE
ncbi:MAG: hypothetical protein R3F37_06090 [Candidatus Competibacteraceae bacterium]